MNGGLDASAVYSMIPLNYTATAGLLYAAGIWCLDDATAKRNKDSGNSGIRGLHLPKELFALFVFI